MRKPQPAVENIKVLMYHRIVEDKETAQRFWNCVHVDEFKSHLNVLDKLGYTTITLSDYWLLLVGELTLPKKPVILTFDDGYLDTYEQAFPVIQEYGMRAVVFALGNRGLDYNYWDHGTEYPGARLMNNRQLLEMNEGGIEIGSHSMDHVKLTKINPSEARRQIIYSKNQLEDLLGHSVQSFSYPYGLVNMNIREFVIKAGYRFGCSVYTGPPLFGGDLYDIRRLTVRNDVNAMGLASRLLLPFEYYEWSRWRLRNVFSQQEKELTPEVLDFVADFD